MKKVQNMTIDELHDVLQWIADRAAYYRAIGRPQPGALYAADDAMERSICAELYRRGF